MSAPRKRRLRVALTDSEAMHAAHPETWDHPDAAELAALGPGWAIKVLAGQERFWVRVTSRDGNRLRGLVDNALVDAAHIGVDLGDEIECETRHVLDVWRLPDA